MARGALPTTSFTKPDGSVLSDGYLLVQLSTDAKTSSNQQVGGKNSVQVPLDSNGSILGTPTFPTNASLTPPGTTYLVRAYTTNGELAYENNLIQVV